MQANSSSAFMPPKRSEPVIIIESGTSTRATGTRTTRAKRTRAEAEISVTAAAGTSTVSTTKPTKTRKKAKTTETQAQYAPSEMSLEQLLQAGGCAHLLVCQHFELSPQLTLTIALVEGPVVALKPGTNTKDVCSFTGDHW